MQAEYMSMNAPPVAALHLLSPTAMEYTSFAAAMNHSSGAAAMDYSSGDSLEWNSLESVAGRACDALVRPSAKTKRCQISRACQACRSAKAKCTETRPCPRCVRLKIADTCGEDTRAGPAKRHAGVMVTANRVERPIPFKVCRNKTCQRSLKKKRSLPPDIRLHMT
jgi:hypothetical protein